MISNYTGGLGASLLCLPGGRKEINQPEPLLLTGFELFYKNVVTQKNKVKLPGLTAGIGINVKIPGGFDKSEQHELPTDAQGQVIQER